MTSVPELPESHSRAIQLLNTLNDRVAQRRAQLHDTDVATYSQRNGVDAIRLGSQDLVCCRTLQGHNGKIYSLDWARNADRIASASQDGHLIVWNALTSQKTHAIKLACSWVMTCAFSPLGHHVACGGLDSVCSIYTLNGQQEQAASERKVLSGHKGYISCCKYLPDQETQILTSSGDGTCILWDVENRQKISIFGGNSFSGHTADVMSLSITKTNPQWFVSGSCDGTARLWDLRNPNKVAQTFRGHQADVNTVQFLPDGLRFGTGCDDGICRMFDIRTGHQLQEYCYEKENESAKATSIAFSHSGRLLFAAYSNAECYVWDTLLAKVVCKLSSLPDSHKEPISCLGLASDGSALCTGSWDKNLKVWAFNIQK